MAARAGTYFPIRPADYKPAPVPYFDELMKAQNILPLGITALAASVDDEDEKEKKIDISDDDIFTQEEKDILNKLPPGLRESMGESLKGQKEKLTKTLQEEKEVRVKIKQKIKSDLTSMGLKEDLAESIADSATERAFEKMSEGISGPQAMKEALKELEQLSGAISTKHAQGGLIGINELTRGL